MILVLVKQTFHNMYILFFEWVNNQQQYAMKVT